MQKSDTLDKFFRNSGSICPFAKIAADNEAIVYAHTSQLKDQLIAFLTDSSKQVFVFVGNQIPDTHQEAKDLIYSMFSKTFTELVKLQTQLLPEEIATFINSQMAMFDDPNSPQRPMLGHDNKPMYAIGMSPNYDKKHPRYAPILCLVVTWMADVQLARMQYPNSVTKIRAAMKSQTGSVYDADELYLRYRRNPDVRSDEDLEYLEKVVAARRIYQETKNLAETARQVGVSTATVRRWVVGLAKEESDLKIKQVREYFRKTGNVTKTAQHFGINYRKILKWVADIRAEFAKLKSEERLKKRQQARQIYLETGNLTETVRRVGQNFSVIKGWVSDLIPDKPSEDELKTHARELYLKIRNIKKVAKQLGVGLKKVSGWVDDLIRYGRDPDPQLVQEARRLYALLGSTRKVAQQMGIKRGHVVKWVKDIDREALRRQEARKIYQETGNISKTAKRLGSNFTTIKKWVADLIPSEETLKAEARRIYLETGSTKETAKQLRRRVSRVRKWVKEKHHMRRRNPEKDPFRNEDHDIQEAFDHIYNWHYSSECIPEKLDISMFDIQYFPAWTLQQIEDFEEEIEFGAWGEWEENEFVGLSEDEILDIMGSFRDKKWAERNYQWYKDNDLPAIVLVKSSSYTGLADGRGRFNIATAFGLETLPVILLTRKEQSKRHNPAVPELEALRSMFCVAAQEVYDEWDQDEEGYSEEYAYGGICHDIATAIQEILEEHDISSTSFSQSIGDVHVWAVADIDGDAYRVDVIPYLYEHGGGYTWRKIPDIAFVNDDIVIEPMADPFSDYLED